MSADILTIRLHDADNVVTAKTTIAPDTAIPGEPVTTAMQIPVGHKVAVCAIKFGEAIRKYNQIIGFASTDIAAGEHVHTQNVEMKTFERDYAYGTEATPTVMVPDAERATFQGIVRDDGRVATRNYIGIVSSVNCSATVSRFIADAFKGDALADYPNIDGVVALVQSYGCGTPDVGIGWDFFQNTLNGYKSHPNFVGIVVVGLGCEVNQVQGMFEQHGWQTGKMLAAMTIQDSGGTRKTVAEGVARVREMLPDANRVARTTVPASHLTLGLECGGSDAYSGITANPALGAAADLLVRHGGTAVLAETPEIYGAEHLLTRRAETKGVGDKLIQHVLWWEDYTAKNGAEMNNNPSPGNKGRRLDHDPREISRRGRQGRHHQLGRCLSICRPDHRQGLLLHEHAGLRRDLGQRHGRRRRQRGVLHYRPRLGIWLQAHAQHQARHQHHDVHPHGRGHGRQLRADHRRRSLGRGNGRDNIPENSRHRIGRAHQRAKSSAMATKSSCRGTLAR